jgi:hypothetical protein
MEDSRVSKFASRGFHFRLMILKDRGAWWTREMGAGLSINHDDDERGEIRENKKYLDKEGKCKVPTGYRYESYKTGGQDGERAQRRNGETSACTGVVGQTSRIT